jgi:hypothetical protein
MPRLRHALPAAALLLGAARRPAAAQPGAPAAAAPAAAAERLDGFLPLRHDARTGKVLIELPGDSTRVLLLTSLATGLGSNPVGLDRGANGESYVVRFDRSGDKVLAVLENWQYRSSDTANAAHQRSVAEAFPPSTVAALPVVATEGRRIVVDATDLVVRDWMDVPRTLQRAGQGQYAVARDRSALYRPRTRNFPRNTEVDVALTFAAQNAPGPIVESIVPDGRAFTVREHLSFVPLPDGYRPRPVDPRVGYYGVRFHDYAQPIDRPLAVRWAARHRLERGPDGRVANPIVYYVDPGIPEPVRTATMQGVKWWEDAFARAGLPGAFRVEWLPAGADPMDVRYNVVQWENRNERGWSIGGSLADPRTGEIVKAMARMDSHRARTDYNLYAGLVGADAAAADTAFVLARVRQVSAHEVGHTLGLTHNYVASVNGRASVMDYPPPRVLLRAAGADTTFDLSQAYGVGPGDYDVWAIRWGYTPFPGGGRGRLAARRRRRGAAQGLPVPERQRRAPRLRERPAREPVGRRDHGGRLLAPADRGPAAGDAPLRRGGRAPGRPGRAAAGAVRPVYFMHRFALNRLAKALGGVEYAATVRGDGQQATRVVAPARQRAALALIAGALAPAALDVPDTVRTLLGPGADAVTPGVELFRSQTRPVFDALGAARTLAGMVADAALQRDRAARLVQQAAFSAGQLSLADVATALLDATRPANGAPEREAALRRVAHRAVLDRLLALAADTAASPEVRAMADLKLGEAGAALARQLRGMGPGPEAARGADAAQRAFLAAAAGDVERWRTRREVPRPTPALVAPPGDPFGEAP